MIEQKLEKAMATIQAQKNSIRMLNAQLSISEKKAKYAVKFKGIFSKVEEARDLLEKVMVVKLNVLELHNVNLAIKLLKEVEGQIK